MLRTMVVACALVLPGLAAAQDFPQAVTGMEVKAEDGAVIGHVAQATRNRHGRVVSASIPGAEPASAGASAQPPQADQFPLLVRYDLRGRETPSTAAGPARGTALR
ncbi:MAG: hypothetical protein ABUS57_11495 [Pseudomonadota bacterium]